MSIPKIAGIETEYGITILGGERKDPFYASEKLLEAYRHCIGKSFVHDSHTFGVPAINSHITHNSLFTDYDLFLPNGSRFYIDHAHPEYSTPECLSPRALIASDKAGEYILSACRDWVNTNNILETDQELRIYKNNSDHKGNTYGCHENYLIEARTFHDLLHSKTQKVFRYIIPFLVTRIIFCGAGKVGSENNAPPCTYQLSQRADFFETLMGMQTTLHRPIFNKRDEPHADKRKFRRLHVIPGDANMSEISSYLKIGTTQLVLRMIEDEWLKEDITIEDPINEFKMISRDLSFNRNVKLENGMCMSALDIQHIYLDSAYKYLVQMNGSIEEWDVWNRWSESINKLPGKWQELAFQIDWAIKKYILDCYLKKMGVTWEETGKWIHVIEKTIPFYQSNHTERLDKTSENCEDDYTQAKEIAKENGLKWQDFPKHKKIYFGLRRLDLEYHDIQSGKENTGLYYHLQKKGSIKRLLNDREIKQSIHDPPENSRAWFRGNCISQFSEDIYSIDWEYINIVDHSSKSALKYTISLANPFQHSKDGIKDIWKQVTSLHDVVHYFSKKSNTIEGGKIYERAYTQKRKRNKKEK